MANYLADKGHQVTIITGAKTERTNEYAIKVGLNVIEIPDNYSHYHRWPRRIFDFLRFTIKVLALLRKLPKADLIFATSTPLTIGLPALYAKWRWKVPYLFEVRDLWPDAALALGMVKNPWLIKMARILEKTLYRHSEAVVALSPDIRAHIQNICPATQIETIPNIADTHFFSPKAAYKAPPWVISYIGTIGRANDLGSYLPGLKALHERYPGQFVCRIMGEGNALEELKQTAAQSGLEGFISYIPTSDRLAVKALLAESSLTLVSFVDDPRLGAGSPNKFFDALAAGVPVAINFPGWIEKKIASHHIGIKMTRGQENRFASKVMAVCRNQEIWEEMAENCLYAAINYTPKQAGHKLEALIKRLSP